jgi:hypothetical protein
MFVKTLRQQAAEGRAAEDGRARFRAGQDDATTRCGCIMASGGWILSGKGPPSRSVPFFSSLPEPLQRGWAGGHGSGLRDGAENPSGRAGHRRLRPLRPAATAWSAAWIRARDP